MINARMTGNDRITGIDIGLTSRRPQQGLTLLELLVAISVFALLSAMAYGGLNSVLNTAEHTRSQAERLAEMQLAFNRLQRDLVQISDRPIRDTLGDRQPALQYGTGLTLLEFTKSGWRNPTDQARSSLQRVAYRLEDNELQRLAWSHLDRAANATPFTATLLTEVDDVQFRFMDGQQRWHDTWPPLNTRGEAGLPRAIEITVVPAGWDDIVRLFAL